MLTTGFNHVAIITKDADRLLEFYGSVFGAKKSVELVDGPPDKKFRLMIIDVGPYAELNVFEMPDNPEADRQTPSFGRGRIDHLALLAESMPAFEEIRAPAHRARRGRRFRHRLRQGAQRVLPRSRRPRVRSVRGQPRLGGRRREPARHSRGPLRVRYVVPEVVQFSIRSWS